MVRASNRSMPRTRWKLLSVAVLPVSVSSTSGCSGIACPERLGALGPCRVGCERLAVCCPERAVLIDRGLDAQSVDVLEQAPAQHLDGLVLFGRIEQRGLARGHALRFAHLVGDVLVLLAVGVARPSVLADRERVDERGVRCPFHGLEQRGQECGELVPRIPHAADLSEVDRELVEEDERRLATEQLAQRLRPGRNARLVALADPLVAIPSRERTGDLAPRRVGQYAVAHGPAIGRIGVLAVEGGDPHSAVGQQRWVDELGDVRHGPEPVCGVREGDQAVGLAPAIGGIETEDGSDFAAGPGQPSADVPEQALEPSCRVGVGEEPHRVPVLGASLSRDHRGEIGCEVRFRDLAPEHVAPWRAGVEHGWNCHRFRSELRWCPVWPAYLTREGTRLRGSRLVNRGVHRRGDDTAAMKTAISIPDDVFEGAERTASALGLSRSELYATAVREFVERYRSADVTERLDRIYGEDDSLSRLDERLRTLQAYSLGRDDWR